VGGDVALERVAGGEVGAERGGGGGGAQLERGAGLPDPELGGVDAVPVAGFALGEEEEDRRAGAAGAVVSMDSSTKLALPVLPARSVSVAVTTTASLPLN
jgi:hypothetical protein